MRFLILTQYFPPEVGAPQTRLQSVATELMRLGHEVEIVTALPNYPSGRFFPGYERRFYMKSFEDGLPVHRLWLYPSMGSGKLRMLNYASFGITSLFGLLRARRPDFIFVESPPLSLSITGFLGGLFWRVPFILNVADLWPDVVVETGLIRDGFLLRLLRRLEDWSYRRARYINAVTDGIRKNLIEKKGIPASKILSLPNGVDTLRFKPQDADDSLKRRLGLEGKRIVLWAGTLGHAHGLEHALRAADLLRSNPEIHFLFVGDGSARPSLIQLRDELQLENVTFHDPVPLNQLPSFYSISEMGLACVIGIPAHDGTRPSKVFPNLASGKPVVFAGSGEGARLVQQARAGLVVPPEDAPALANAILHLVEDPELGQTLGRNGRFFVEENLQWSKLTRDWLASLAQLQERHTLLARANQA